jgi:hypothetical protein
VSASVDDSDGFGRYERLITDLDAAGARYRLCRGTGRQRQRTVLPFSDDPRLEVVADPALLDVPELFFNAARLDRSIALATDDYVRLAAPRIAPITIAS